MTGSVMAVLGMGKKSLSGAVLWPIHYSGIDQGMYPAALDDGKWANIMGAFTLLEAMHATFCS